MYNICRPFVLFHDFLPPSTEVHKDWDYLSYGYYDGVSVGENLFFDGIANLNRLWEYAVKRSISMRGQYQEQVIFGFRNDENQDREKDFWNAEIKSKYPFLFLSLLQFDDEGESDQLFEKCRKLEKAMTDEEAGYRAITYLTLDNSDLILVLLSKSYLTAIDLVDSLHREKGRGVELISCLNWSLRYSFTVASLYRETLNDSSKLEEETLPFVYIYAIEKNPGSVDYIYSQIRNIIGETYLSKEKQSTLGCNDELIILKDIPWSKFCLLYQDMTGILNHSSSFYQKYLIGVTTIIGKPHQIKKIEQSKLLQVHGSSQKSEKQESLSDILRKEFGKLDLINNVDCVRCHNLKKDLYQILNTLQRFEITSFPDYVFRTLLLPLNMVKTIMKNATTMNQKDKLFISFYDFFKAIGLYAQNSVKSDRQFTQSFDYNIRIYHTPVKLNAFYNAFIYNLKEYLNSFDMGKESKHNYEFIACPGITDNMQVQELFDSLMDTEKLFIVNIPENQMYNTRLMMVMLGHEVGHFVGMDIRNRVKRVKYIEKIVSRITIQYYRISLNNEEMGEIPKEYWHKLECELELRLNKFMEYQCIDKYIQEKYLDVSEENINTIKQNIKKYSVYSNLLNILLQDAITYILLEESEELFSYLLETVFDFTLGKSGLRVAEKERNKLQTKIYRITNEWLSNFSWNEKATTLSSVIDLIIENFKECVADMIGILTLHLSLFDYLSAVLQSSSDQGRNQNPNTKILVRCALVVFCMTTITDEYGYNWGDKEQQYINNYGDEKVIYFSKYIYRFLDIYFTKEDSMEKLPKKNEYQKNAINVLYDSVVLQELAKYLLICKRTFEENNGKEKKVKQEKLIRIYKLHQEKSIEKIILGVQEYIDDYQRIVTKEMEKLIREEAYE